MEFYAERNLSISSPNVRNDLVLKPSMNANYLRLSGQNFEFIFLVLRALQTNDLLQTNVWLTAWSSNPRY